jgi:23S rRNA pseudouridine1911/1915/1917 synthase
VLVHHIVRNEKQNKSYAYDIPQSKSKEAKLRYKIIGKSNTFTLLEIELLTGRHHQIRAQLSAISCPIKGDLKYGFPRSNPGGGISLHARFVMFEHPVTKEQLRIAAPYPKNDVWNHFE